MITEIKVGEVYTFNGTSVTIIKIEGTTLTFRTLASGDKGRKMNLASAISTFNHFGYILQTPSPHKQLDIAMKKLDKVYCTHNNITEMTYFTSEKFKHCKDCGIALK